MNQNQLYNNNNSNNINCARSRFISLTIVYCFKAIKTYLETELIPQILLHEFYFANVEKLTEEFIQKARVTIPTTEGFQRTKLTLLCGSSCGRNQAKVDLDLAVKIFNINR